MSTNPSTRSGFWQRLFSFGPIAREISRRASLAVRAIADPRDTRIGGGNQPRDRYPHDRETQLRDALETWRTNPLGRRIVSLTTQYVVGAGIWLETKHDDTRKFLKEFWEHRLNRMAVRVFEWCDELSRSGEIFVVISTDGAGMSYVRAVPALDIKEIRHAPNDIEQPAQFNEYPRAGETLPRTWTAYDEANDDPSPDDGSFPPRMLHYAINRPIGAQRGESDLAPLIKWIARYSNWLEDRARLNRFRQAFIWLVTGKFASAEERAARQAEINANPPNPGATLVADESEKWEALSPKLESGDAEKDGLSMKKMVAAGSGNPLHFLAEPESSTRTTAEAAGGPTYRHYQQRQLFFLWLLTDIAKIVVRRAHLAGRRVALSAEVTARGTDISARDNSSLAIAASSIVAAFTSLYDRGLIDERELIRLSYAFAGEVVDVDELLKKIVPPRNPTPSPKTAPSAKPPTDSEGVPEDKPEEEL